tara:strand:+ start:270 stop:494 length:225 start_codon:yes stop_codon:yes gene_type:complete
MDTKNNNNITIQLTVSDDLLNKVLRVLAPTTSPSGGGMPIPMSLLAGMIGNGGKPEPKEEGEKPTAGFKIKPSK